MLGAGTGARPQHHHHHPGDPGDLSKRSLKQRCGDSGALGAVGLLGTPMTAGPGAGRRMRPAGAGGCLHRGAVPASSRAATRGKWRPTVPVCHRSRARYRRGLKAQGPSHRSVGTGAGVEHPVPSARPSIPARSRAGPPAPSPFQEQAVPSGSHGGTAAGQAPPAGCSSRGLINYEVASQCPAVTLGCLPAGLQLVFLPFYELSPK